MTSQTTSHLQGATSASLSVTEVVESAPTQERGAKTQLTASPCCPVRQSRTRQSEAGSPPAVRAEGTRSRAGADPSPSPLSVTASLLARYVAAQRIRREIAEILRDDGELVEAIDAELDGRLAMQLVEEGRW